MYRRIIYSIDTHTEGDITRFIIGGVPYIKGNDMAAKQEFFKEKFDNVRKIALQEPRGHKDMFGAVFTEPISDESSYGLIFIDNDGYLSSCGHAIMASAVVAKLLGMVDEKQQVVKVDTIAGIAKAKYMQDSCNHIEIEAIPAFSYLTNRTIDVPDIGEVKVDIAFGGNFFAFVDYKELSLDPNDLSINNIRELGIKVKEAVNSQLEVEHPEYPHINSVDLVEIVLPPSIEEASCKNLLICGDGTIGRDPCATGTTAKMALEYEKECLKTGEKYIVEGILGTTFAGKIETEVTIGDRKGIMPFPYRSNIYYRISPICC